MEHIKARPFSAAIGNGATEAMLTTSPIFCQTKGIAGRYRETLWQLLKMAFEDLALVRLLPRQSAEQKKSEHDEEDVGEPDKQLGMDFRIAAERIADDHEQKVGHGHD